MQNSETLTSQPKQKDKIYATYWWLMKMDPNHDFNSPRVTEMDGYSKYKGHDEAKDKEYLLMSRVMMLVQNGYLEKTNSIEIFFRCGPFINKSRDPKIITLYKKDFSFESHFLQNKFHEWHVFFSKLYSHLREGKGIETLLPKKKANFSKDDYLDTSKLNFTSESQLQMYCTKLIRNGHSFEAVKHFERKYKETQIFKK